MALVGGFPELTTPVTNGDGCDMALCADALLIVKEEEMALKNIDNTRRRDKVITYDIFLPAFELLVLSLLSCSTVCLLNL
jgi:hypothetical protein